MTENAPPSFAERTVIGDFETEGKQRNLKDVADGTVLVGQMHHFYGNDKQCAMIVDVHLLSVEWVFQFSIENDSKGARTKQVETEIGMTATSGKEVLESISANGGFTGWGFSAEVNGSTETKTFTSIETSNKTRITDKYDVPPESSSFVYKKQYKFRCRPWVYWAPENASVQTKASKKCEGHFDNEIIANQELISPVELTNHGRITNNPPSDIIRPSRVYTLKNDLFDTEWYGPFKEMYPWLPDSYIPEDGP